jgi:hypothetical protein
MTEIDAVQSDLQYIRKAVETRRSEALPMPIAVYWAIVGLIGFALVDFAPERTGLFWLIAAPVGFVFSTWAGWRDGRARGDVDRTEGARIAWHWVGMMAVILLAAMLVNNGQVEPEAFGRLTLLIVAFSYFTAGLHSERILVWIGVLLAAGFVALSFVHTYVWTTLGLLLCIALLGAAFAGRAGRSNG